jgi:tetratricopeptide (TPR) repeat protein
MSERVLTANQRRVDRASDPFERTRLLQEQVVILARLGRVEAARVVLEQARMQAPIEAPPSLLLRFDYAAAIQLYFAKRFTEATTLLLEVTERARLAGDDPALIGECESALSLFMQRENDVRAAARYARSVLANTGATPESRYRALLALGSLHQDAYDYVEAARLYRQAEGLVRQLNDEIAMSSWLRRSAATQAAHARQAAALDELDSRTLANAIGALKKGIAFANGFPDGPDTTLDHLLLAEMLVLQNRPADALTIYDQHLPNADGEGFLHEVTAAMADRAQCCIRLSRTAEGNAQLEQALKRVDEATPSDIRAIVHSNMATALRARGRDAEAEQHRQLADMAWQTYAHEQREARRLLSGDPADTLH